MRWPWRAGRRDRPGPVALLLPEPLDAQVDDPLRAGRLVEAVRLVRQRTGADLLVATRAVKHREQPRPPTA